MKRPYFVIFNPLKVYGIALAVLTVLFVIGGVEYYSYGTPGQQTGDKLAVPAPPAGRVSIVIKLSGRVLEVYDDDKFYKRYPIAAGKGGSPSPVGDWNIVHKERSWREIFGTRWMGLDVPWGSYGIHGTNMPWSIGHFASKGCIRMRNKDVEELYQWVPVGTHVKIKGPVERVTRALRAGTMGQDVVSLQQKLKEIGYLEIRPTGVFGQDTEEALKRFQHDKKLKVTGITDKATLQLLGI